MTLRESVPNTGETADTKRLTLAAHLAGNLTAVTARGGVYPAPSSPFTVQQTPTASASIRVSPGVAAVPLSAGSGLNGITEVVNDAPLQVPYLQAHPAAGQPRTDLIVIRAQDTAGSDSSTVNTIEIVEGTAGSSAAPTVPVGWNALPLYTCALPANATTIQTGYLTRVVPTVAAAGGTLAVPDAPTRLTLTQYEGLRCRQHDTGVTYESNGTAWTPVQQPAKTVFASPVLPAGGSLQILGSDSVGGVAPAGCSFAFTPTRDGVAHVTTRIEGRAISGGFGHGIVQITLNGPALFQSTWVDFVVRDNEANWEGAEIVRSPVAVTLTAGVPVTLAVFVKSDTNSGQWELTSLQFVVETE